MSIDKLSDLLDEHIAKGLAKERRPSKIDRIEEDICKGLSFNPYTPHNMREDSPYYNPYFMSADGSGYAPYPAEYWEEQGNFRQGDYDQTRKFYATVGDAPIAELWSRPSSGTSIFNKFKKSIDDFIIKGKAVPIGTTHEYGNGNTYKKVAEGKWVEVAGREKRTSQLLNHPQYGKQVNDEIERRAQKHEAIMGALKTKQKEDALVERARNETMQHVIGHTKEAMGKMYDGKPPKEVQDFHKEAEKKYKPDPANSPEQRVKGLKKELKPKTHHVHVNFTHQGKDYEHKFQNVQAENHMEAIQKVTDGLKQKLPGHVVTKIHAETPKGQMPKGQNSAEAKMEGPSPKKGPPTEPPNEAGT